MACFEAFRGARRDRATRAESGGAARGRGFLGAMGAAVLAMAVAAPPKAAAETLTLIGRYELPAGLSVVGVPFGGLSALDYDPESETFYALSDDRGRGGPPRFYTLSLAIEPEGVAGLDILAQTPILLEGGQEPARGEIDPEALRLGPDGVVYWGQEGGASGRPSLGVMGRDGKQIAEFTLPAYYFPAAPEPAAEAESSAETSAESSAETRAETAADANAQTTVQTTAQSEASSETAPAAPAAAPASGDGAGASAEAASSSSPQGVRRNNAIEALAIDAEGRVVAGLEQALLQDGPKASVETGSLARLLVLSADSGAPVAEHLYPISPAPFAPIPSTAFHTNGLTALLGRPEGGFYALERSFAAGQGSTAAIYATSFDGATNVLGAASLDGLEPQPMKKRLLYSIAPRPGLPYIDNLEGMSFGPMVDGRRTLVLVSDDNFSRLSSSPRQVTQFLVFAIED